MLVKEITKEGPVKGLYMILESRRRVAKNGNLFAALRVGDQSGEMPLKVWEISEETFAELQKGRVIKLEAAAKTFNNMLQLEADGRRRFFRVCTEDEYPLTDFLPVSPVPAEKSWSVLDRARAEVELLPYRELLAVFFAQKSFREKFATAPAALRHHHAYVGGLLEHTAGVVTLCRAALAHYPHLNSDLLLTGALLHDIGKVRSYQTGSGFENTDEGKLLGHLVAGIRMVTEAVNTARRSRGKDFFPPAVELPLIHLLAGHHGLKEWGSPVEPVFLEACLLHHADYMDSQIAKYQEAIRSRPEETGSWTPYNQNLNHAVYLPDLAWEMPAATEEETTGES